MLPNGFAFLFFVVHSTHVVVVGFGERARPMKAHMQEQDQGGGRIVFMSHGGSKEAQLG